MFQSFEAHLFSFVNVKVALKFQWAANEQSGIELTEHVSIIKLNNKAS